jgi:hypothetical protein
VVVAVVGSDVAEEAIEVGEEVTEEDSEEAASDVAAVDSEAVPEQEELVVAADRINSSGVDNGIWCFYSGFIK